MRWHPPRGVLAELVTSAREDCQRRRRARPGVPAEAAQLPRHSPRFRQALLGGTTFPLICEVKRSSPSAGRIANVVDASALALAYARGGARCVSVLTEGRRFGGSLEDLAQVRAAVKVPLLRKDFVVDPYMVEEAALAGADAVLLIAAAVERPLLAELAASAAALGLDVLLEVVSFEEVDTAAALNATLVGVNARDLETLEVDAARFARLAPALRAPGRTLVAESGIKTAADLIALANAGATAALVGETLMRAQDAEAAVRALSEAPCPA
ncbi:MAG: indole-3-glycerol phosphate synthase TrpC [Myxococcaceae bacterium]